MNFLEFNLSYILKNERENFQNAGSKNIYKKYVKAINRICSLLKKQLVKENKFEKKREDNPEWFDAKKKSYKLKKADNAKFQKFPEPEFFTTKTEYYEYLKSNISLSIPISHKDYQYLLAFSIHQSKLEDIYDLLEYHENNYHSDFAELMYHLNLDFSFLFSQETQIVLYNRKRGVPKNHPEIFERIKEWKEGTMVSMYAFQKEEMEELGKSISPEMEELLEYMAKTPVNVRREKINMIDYGAPIAPVQTMDEEKVSFSVEMRSVFLTEERNWSKRTQYTKQQLIYVKKLVAIVQDFLIRNGIILQSKEDDPQYFWNNKRNWRTRIKQRKKNKFFPELEYFILGDDIYYYFSDYSYEFEPENTFNYQLFFAFRLKQMLLKDLDSFLSKKRQEFEGNFMQFLELIMVEYECLFSMKTIKMVAKWQKKLQRKSQKEIVREIIKPVYAEEPQSQVVEPTFTNPKKKELKSFLEIPFQKPPSGYVQIECKLKEHQIKKFLSFIYLENNGSEDGKSFLLEEELKEAFKFGLAYPEEEPKKKYYSLNIDNRKRLKGIIGFMFYHLYKNNKPTIVSKDYKNQYAKFLRYTFDNFTESELSTRDLLRGQIPSRLNEKKFDYQKYIDFLS